MNKDHIGSTLRSLFVDLGEEKEFDALIKHKVMNLDALQKERDMKNEEYVKLVNQNEFPATIQVPIDQPYSDERGKITNIWLGNCGSVTVITSKQGSVRARHTHTDDWHSFYMVSGEVQYTEKDHEGRVIHAQTYRAGEAFFSRPDVWHEMLFTEDSIGVTCNGIVKNHENYNKTVNRFDL